MHNTLSTLSQVYPRRSKKIFLLYCKLSLRFVAVLCFQLPSIISSAKKSLNQQKNMTTSFAYINLLYFHSFDVSSSTTLWLYSRTWSASALFFIRVISTSGCTSKIIIQFTDNHFRHANFFVLVLKFFV